ncbi:hypothetical protein CANINC_002583 [Pichia inconspicua]|uniref:Major facilitator superfamily (MFS) profile domain-containing protein n=1 Tax=Pichia inconspicua TaxID=52247 RepID=A0A4V4NFP0_9ASCO|nr:hypothetical protein CANINC_002583 [[Candida] inconspicua]
MESESLNFAIRTYQQLRNVVPMEKRNIFLVYFLILLGTALDNFNSAGGMTLAINIQEAYKTSSVITSWVLSAYALTLGAFIMLTGKLADIFGPHNVYIFGLLIMWVCVLVCACLPQTSIIPLIVFRAFQGLGASALIPSSIALAANYFTGPYEKFLGRSIVLLIVAVTGRLTEGGENWKSSKAIAPLIVGFFTFIASFIYEIFYLKRFQMKHEDKDPSYDWKLEVQLLFPPELIKIPNFVLFLLVCGFHYATYAMIHVAGIEYYSFVEHNSPIIAALKVFPATLRLIFGASTYRLSYYKKIGLRNMFVLSAFMALAGTIWFSRINFQVKNSYWKYNCFALFLYGYGVNIFFNIYMVIVVERTPLHLQGVVSGVYQTCCQVLLSFGNALVPSIVGSIELANSLEEKISLHKKLRTLFYIIIALQAVPAVILTLFLKTPQNGKEKENLTIVSTNDKESNSDEISESLKTGTNST